MASAYSAKEILFLPPRECVDGQTAYGWSGVCCARKSANPGNTVTEPSSGGAGICLDAIEVKDAGTKEVCSERAL